MDITIFGLGYVGCVGLGCLAEQGHNLTGVVDQQPRRIPRLGRCLGDPVRREFVVKIGDKHLL